jgi:6-phosphogluconolactonase
MSGYLLLFESMTPKVDAQARSDEGRASIPEAGRIGEVPFCGRVRRMVRFQDIKRQQTRRGKMRSSRILGVVALGALGWLTGCAGFFSDPNTTTATGSTTGDYVYVVNQETDTVAGFAITTGTLTALSTATNSLTTGLSPTSAVVTRQNSIVYIGGNGAIQAFSIGSSGVLAALSGGGITTSGVVESMATSPDGQWLLALSAPSTTSQGAQISVYGINTSTGLLTLAQSLSITFPTTQSIGTVVPKALRISPSGAYVAAALGTAGDALFSFTTSTGLLAQTANRAPATTTSSVGFLSDNTLTFDSTNDMLFIGTTGASTGQSYITALPISGAGVLASTGQTIPSGDSPISLEMDSTGAYLYSANHASANISGYTFSSATLAAMSSSPFATSSGINALVRDKSGDYIVAVSGSGSSDVTLYGFDAYTTGRLDAILGVVSGTDPADSVAAAATH